MSSLWHIWDCIVTGIFLLTFFYNFPFDFIIGIIDLNLQSTKNWAFCSFSFLFLEHLTFDITRNSSVNMLLFCFNLHYEVLLISACINVLTNKQWKSYHQNIIILFGFFFFPSPFLIRSDGMLFVHPSNGRHFMPLAWNASLHGCYQNYHATIHSAVIRAYLKMIQGNLMIYVHVPPWIKNGGKRTGDIWDASAWNFISSLCFIPWFQTDKQTGKHWKGRKNQEVEGTRHGLKLGKTHFDSIESTHLDL